MKGERNQHDSVMASLFARFVQRCNEDAAALEGWRDSAAAPDTEIIERLHKLAGIAGTFGRHSLGEEAANLEAMMTRGEPVPDQLWEEFCSRLRNTVSQSSG